MNATMTFGNRAFVGDALAGSAVASGLALHWVSDGQGQSLRGLDLADQLIRGPIVPEWGAVVGGALYATVAFGTVLVASSPLRHALVGRCRLVACLVLLVSFVAIALLGWFPFTSWGAAPALATAGFIVSIMVNGIEERRRLSSVAG